MILKQFAPVERSGFALFAELCVALHLANGHVGGPHAMEES